MVDKPACPGLVYQKIQEHRPPSRVVGTNFHQND